MYGSCFSFRCIGGCFAFRCIDSCFGFRCIWPQMYGWLFWLQIYRCLFYCLRSWLLTHTSLFGFSYMGGYFHFRCLRSFFGTSCMCGCFSFRLFTSLTASFCHRILVSLTSRRRGKTFESGCVWAMRQPRHIDSFLTNRSRRPIGHWVALSAKYSRSCVRG